MQQSNQLSHGPSGGTVDAQAEGAQKAFTLKATPGFAINVPPLGQMNTNVGMIRSFAIFIYMFTNSFIPC